MKQIKSLKKEGSISAMALPNLKQNKSSNSWHSILLIIGMSVILSAIGFVMFGKWGIAVAIVLGIIALLFANRISPRIVLRMYKAKPILNNHSPELYAMFHLLCRRANLEPMPGLFYVPSKMPNAFAVGHDETAAVALTDGVLRIMNPRELQGIMAHEVAHLMHRDTHVMGLADTISRVTSTLSRIGLLVMAFSLSTLFTGSDPSWFLIRGAVLFFAPTLTILLQLALSRSREFNADLGAVELTGDPYGLASALEKLDKLSDQQSFWQKILVPGRKQEQPAILRTHPDTDERIKILLGLAKKQEVQPSLLPARQVPQTTGRRIPIGFEPRVRAKPRYHIMSGIFR